LTLQLALQRELQRQLASTWGGYAIASRLHR